MKKLIALVPILLFALIGFAQPKVTRSTGANTTMDTRLGAIKNFLTPVYSDTGVASQIANIGIDSCGAQIFTYDVMGLWVRACNPKRWVRVGSVTALESSNSILVSGAGSDESPYIPTLIPSTQSGNIIQIFPDGVYATTQTSIPNGLISGGLVIWQSGLTYIVTAAQYAIGGVIYNSPQTTITLSIADVTDPRFDAFVVTTSNTAVDITGTPAADPQNPSFDPATQLPLTFVQVTANMIEPVFCRDSIYFPNNGQTWSGAVSNPGRINLTSTSNHYSVTQDIEFTLAQNGDQLRLTKSVPISWSTYSVVLVWVRSKATWNASSRLVVRMYNGLTPQGIDVVIGDGIFGFNSSITNAYQLVAIPRQNFGVVVNADNILFTVSTTGANTIGLHLDDINLLGCEGTPVPVTGRFWSQGGDVWGTTGVLGTNDAFPVQFKANNTNHTILNTNGTSAMTGSNPGISLQLNSFANADYFIRRSGTDLITNTAGTYLTRYQGNTVYSFIAASGHIFYSPAAAQQMILSPLGALRLNNYGDNTFTGTATRWLAVDVDGNVIEQAAPLTGLTADNGLTASTSTNVQLGGTLSQATTVTGSTNLMTFTSARTGSNYTMLVANSSTGRGLSVTSTGHGVFSVSASNIGVYGQGGTYGIAGYSPSGSGVQAASDTGIPLEVYLNTATTNATVRTSYFLAQSTGTAANGFGGYIEMRGSTSNGADFLSNQLVSTWTNATTASRTSQFSINGVNSTSTVTILTIAGNGAMTLGAAYQGLGAGYIAVSNAGVLTWSAGGGGGGGDALTANPLSQFAATTSAQLAGVISDETGSGALVFANSPVFTTPNIGTATGSVSGNAGTATVLQTARNINGVSFNGSADITVTAAAGTLTGTTINATVVTSSLTSVGTIATGVWNATAIGITKGGTGLTTIGASGQFLRVNAGATGYEFATVSGSGTVTLVSVTTANGFNGSVANAATTPQISIGVTASGVLVGAGGSITGITNSSTAGQVLRVTGAATYAWGALDLANASAITGALLPANGGTGVGVPFTNGSLLIANGTGWTKATLTAGTGIIITNGVGSVTVSSDYARAWITVTEAGSTINWNTTTGANARVTLNGTGRTLNIQNPIDGYVYTLRVIQGSGGSRTITTWTNVKWPNNGTLPTLSTTAGQYDIFQFKYESSTGFFYGSIGLNYN